MKGISDPRSLFPSGTSDIRKPRLASQRNAFGRPAKAAAIRLFKPIKTQVKPIASISLKALLKPHIAKQPTGSSVAIHLKHFR